MSELEDSLCEENSNKELFDEDSLKGNLSRDTTSHSTKFLGQLDAKPPSPRLEQASDSIASLVGSQELDDSLDEEEFQKLSQLQSPSFLQKKVTTDCLKNIKKQDDWANVEESIISKLSKTNSGGCGSPKLQNSAASNYTIHNSPPVPMQVSRNCNGSSINDPLCTTSENPSSPMLNVPKVKPNFGKKSRKPSKPAGQVDDPESIAKASFKVLPKSKKVTKSTSEPVAGINEPGFSKSKMPKSVSKTLETSTVTGKLKLNKKVKNVSTEDRTGQNEVISRLAAAAPNRTVQDEHCEANSEALCDQQSKKLCLELKPVNVRKPVFAAKKQSTKDSESGSKKEIAFKNGDSKSYSKDEQMPERKKVESKSIPTNVGTEFSDIQKQVGVLKGKRKLLTKDERQEKAQLQKQKMEEKKREKEEKKNERERRKKDIEQKKREREKIRVLDRERKAARKELQESEMRERKIQKASKNEKNLSTCVQKKNSGNGEVFDEEMKSKKGKFEAEGEVIQSACVCPKETNKVKVVYSDEDSKNMSKEKTPVRRTTCSETSAIEIHTSNKETNFQLGVLSPTTLGIGTDSNYGWEINLDALKDTISIRSPIDEFTLSSSLNSEDESATNKRKTTTNGGLASKTVPAKAPKRPPSEEDTVVNPKPKRLRVESSRQGASIEQFLKDLKTEATTESETSVCSETSSEIESGVVVLGSPSSESTQLSSPRAAPSKRKSRVKTFMNGNTAGPVWVQCCNMWCQKWRKLDNHFDPLTVPAVWNCADNTDTNYNDCSLPTERWGDYINEETQFIESSYGPGSVIWGKLESYPWWPAMIEADPDEESYFETSQCNSVIPVKYHVVFFGTPVSRCWLHGNRIIPFTGIVDANEMHHHRVANTYKKALEDSKNEAANALKLNVKERLEVYGFLNRHKTSKRGKKSETLIKVPKPVTQQAPHEEPEQQRKEKVSLTKAERKAVMGVRAEANKKASMEKSKGKTQKVNSNSTETENGGDKLKEEYMDADEGQSIINSNKRDTEEVKDQEKRQK